MRTADGSPAPLRLVGRETTWRARLGVVSVKWIGIDDTTGRLHVVGMVHLPLDGRYRRGVASAEPPRPSAFALWQRSCDEHGQGTDEQRRRYGELLCEHGHIVPREPGDSPNTLPCGWPGSGLDGLIAPEDRDAMNADLAEMTRTRRRAEGEAANWPMP